MSRPLPAKIQSAALTDVGRSRSENQDACALFSSKAESLIAIVADGMGGHSGGATASQIAIATAHELLSPTHEEVDEISLVQAIEEANRRIYEKAFEEPELRGMGTTMVALLFHPDGRAWAAHVGDSRAYRLRGGSFEALTHDHSLVAELVRSGALTEEQAEEDPRRNEILRSVGVAENVEVDVTPVTVHPGDRFLLCSDGLTGPVKDLEVASILGLYDPEDAARTLIARANEMGGPDNITAIALHYPDPNSITDTHTVIGETTATEFELIAVERAEERLTQARKIGLLAAITGLILLGLLVAVLLSSPVHVTPDPATGNATPAGVAETPSATEDTLPYELEPLAP